MIAVVRCLSHSALHVVPASRDSAVIAICAAGAPPAQVPRGYPAVLYLAFDDAPRPAVGTRRRAADFTAELARSTVRFLFTVHRMPTIRSLICTCDDGVTRCTPVGAYAAGLFEARLECHGLADLDASTAYHRLRDVEPMARLRTRLAAARALAMS